MTKAEECRVHARYCATAARFMSSDKAKREFEKQARGWLKIAERVENKERRAKVRLRGLN
jgi:hypothetical protein